MTNRLMGLQTLSVGRRIGLAFVFVWFFVGGLAHFVFAGIERSIMPPYIPWPATMVAISGVCELLGAAGLLWVRTRRAAGIGLFLLTIAVTPANVFMLQHPQYFGIPLWVLIVRLPAQAALLALIWWASARPSARVREP